MNTVNTVLYRACPCSDSHRLSLLDRPWLLGWLVRQKPRGAARRAQKQPPQEDGRLWPSEYDRLMQQQLVARRLRKESRKDWPPYRLCMHNHSHAHITLILLSAMCRCLYGWNFMNDYLNFKRTKPPSCLLYRITRSGKIEELDAQDLLTKSDLDVSRTMWTSLH